MNYKLTLSIDKEIVEQAKTYIRKKGGSLSGLIENYLKLITEKENQDSHIFPEIRKLKGAIKASKNFDYKTELTHAINQKYNK